MLFRVEQVDTNLDYLNDVLLYFLRSAVGQDRFVKSKLFPTQFLPVVNDPRSNVDKKFKALHREIKQLGNSEKALLLRTFRNHSSVEKICGEITFSPKNIFDLPASLVAVLKELGNYLYSSVLRNSKFVGLECVNDSVVKHYSRFISKNGEVCCFCGMRTYTDQLSGATMSDQWSPAYDHYLPKKFFPLTTVNFKNLIPICTNCNSKGKGQINPGYCPDNNRRLSYYPYCGNDMPKLEYKLRINSEDVMDQDIWDVKLLLNGVDEEEQQKRQTWDSLFKITSRLRHRLNVNYKDWVRQALGGESLSGAGLVGLFRRQTAVYMSQTKRTADSLHKATLFSFLANLNIDSLEVLIESANDDVLTPINAEQGREELMELGISI